MRVNELELQVKTRDTHIAALSERVTEVEREN